MKLTSAERTFMKRIARRGGHARALSMSPVERSQSASVASRARWDRIRAQQTAENQLTQQNTADAEKTLAV